MVVLVKRRAGGLYQAHIGSRPTNDRFEAIIERVLLLTSKRALGKEVAHDPFPPFIAESQERAELIAGEAFKAFVKLGTLGL